MENTLFKTSYDPLRKTLECIWSAKTEESTWAEIQNALLKYVEQVEIHHPVNIKVDERALFFIWLPEYQEWVDSQIASRLLTAGVKNFAIILNRDIFMEVSVKQLMDEQNTSKLKTCFFQTSEDADQWLASLQ